MLRDLRIQDFAIIEDLLLTFESGLNIITGDTGAGKSILIEALGLILGGRGSADMIRTGSKQARITARFDLNGDPEKIAQIRDLGLEIDEGDLVIQRILSRAGTARITANGDPATVGLLARIGENLVDIHGQQEHHCLLKRENHLALLDAFGGNGDLLVSYRQCFSRLVHTQRELRRIENEEKDRVRRIDFLRYQIDEIDTVAPKPAEDRELEEAIRVLGNAERIRILAETCYAMLYENENSLSDQVGQLLSGLRELSSLDARAEGISGDGEEIKFQLEDMAHTLRDYASNVESDPSRLAELENRLELLRMLKRKYGETISDVLRFRQEAGKELARLTGSEENRSRLQADLASSLQETTSLAEKLSQKRQQAADRLERKLEKELADLAMQGTRFIVRIEPHSSNSEELQDSKGRSLTPFGYDLVEFLVSPNVGEPPKPLARIASGGELSRIMLSIKTVLASVDRVETLIFDEIDAGIGGRVAEILGRRLRYVAKGRQAICVTHSPQVATQGHIHIHIAKRVDQGRTYVTARALEGKERVQEIARMLGGMEITRTTVQHAREMLNSAK
jgi:DNA repair protein RecN (Recombination protein N)